MNKRGAAILLAAFSLPVIWLGILFGRCCGVGVKLPQFLMNLSTALENPYRIEFTPYTGKSILFCLCCYGFSISYYYATKENTRPGEEYGSAKWGDVLQANLLLRSRDKNDNNAILTENIQIGLNGWIHKRNLNVLVVGGSGAGKTRGYVKPNIMQCNCSYIITDPKGELLRSTGWMLEQQGYEVKVLNLIDMNRSDCYNPLAYIKTDADALRLINNLVKSTTPKTAGNADPFWENSEKSLLQALILYLVHEAPVYEQNFEMVMYMIENAAAKEDDEEYMSPIDKLFETLEERNPRHIALKQYKVFKQAAGKTAKSILVSVAVRLATFNLYELASFTQKDEMELHKLGDRKQAIFAVIPDNDNSFNYLVAMLYAQAFQELYYRAGSRGGRLKVPVRVLMDEWANVALPDDFGNILSTCRSRDISINIIVQNISQIKAMYKDSWESLIGCCDLFLYLGGNEHSTHKYISEMLGKMTIRTKTTGVTKGKSGSSSVNYQIMGRDLMTPDEVRLLDNDYAILFVKSLRAVIDKKYDLMNHKNIALTEDGGVESYIRPIKHLDREPEFDFSAPDLQSEFNLEDVEILEF